MPTSLFSVMSTLPTPCFAAISLRVFRQLYGESSLPFTETISPFFTPMVTNSGSFGAFSGSTVQVQTFSLARFQVSSSSPPSVEMCHALASRL